MKNIIGFFDTISYGTFGITIIDLAAVYSGLDIAVVSTNNILKVVLVVVSLGYFVIYKIPHQIKMNRLSVESKKLENAKMALDIEALEDEIDGKN